MSSKKKPSQRQPDKRCLRGSVKAFKNCHGQEYRCPKTTRVPRYAGERRGQFALDVAGWVKAVKLRGYVPRRPAG